MIKEIYIENFRSIYDPIKIKLGDENTNLHGENDVGKTNILRALKVVYDYVVFNTEPAFDPYLLTDKPKRKSIISLTILLHGFYHSGSIEIWEGGFRDRLTESIRTFIREQVQVSFSYTEPLPLCEALKEAASAFELSKNLTWDEEGKLYDDAGIEIEPGSTTYKILTLAIFLIGDKKVGIFDLPHDNLHVTLWRAIRNECRGRQMIYSGFNHYYGEHGQENIKVVKFRKKTYPYQDYHDLVPIADENENFLPEFKKMYNLLCTLDMSEVEKRLEEGELDQDIYNLYMGTVRYCKAGENPGQDFIDLYKN